MAFKLVLSLAATALAVMLSYIFWKRWRQIYEAVADNDEAANDGTAGGASGAQTSTESRGMGTSSGYDYEVFLSFRGPDTRAGFTDFLYTSLTDAGIRTFKDDEDLRVGEEFAPNLVEAINQSKISIPIFSKGYASSKWCLEELVQMVDCQKNGRQKIMPIFYDVAPSEVRHQTKSYGKALHSHEKKKRCDKTTLNKWKAALSAIGEISGWDLHGKTNKREGQFAKALTHEVLHELKKAYLEVSDNLVRMDDQEYEIMKQIDARSSETRIVGIYGMGGSGKTTIAKFIYNQLVHDFKYCCFLPDVRETSKREGGIHYLQNELISTILKEKKLDIKNADEGSRIIKDRLSNKRVLLLIDDVEEEEHVNALINKGNWLGNGSKVIITTRNKDILEVPEVCSYELEGMNDAQSLKLFSRHAFRKDDPLDEYIHQSEKVIDIAKGLPLTLVVIGSLLSKIKEAEKWDGILQELENIPARDVQKRLKISYDALDDGEKHIFRDIACLFIGYDKDILIYFWDASELSPNLAIEVLQNMCLIKIEEDNTVWMHDQLRDLGREIVRQENIGKPEKRSRVWDPKKGLDLLRRPKGDKEVEALRVELDHPEQYRIIYEGFESLSNLRFLEVDRKRERLRTNKRLPWHEWPLDLLSTNVNSNLLPQLRWLSWHHIPPTFNFTNFSMGDVVILNLSGSDITHDWEGWSHMKVMVNLKVLDLSNCLRLKRTPDFSAQAKLERLILNRCEELEEIDGSICHASLKYLSLTSTKLERLPNTIGKLKSLIELNIYNTIITELPDSFRELKNLKVAKMDEVCLSKIPDSFWMMEKLEEISVCPTMCSVGCHVKIDDRIYGNKSLRILKLRPVVIKKLPRLPESLVKLELHVLETETFPDLSNLTNLKELDLAFPRPPDDDDAKSVGLVEVPIGNLSKLESLNLESFDLTNSTEELSLPPQLKSLRLYGYNLRNLPRLPSSLSSLSLVFCESLCSMGDLSHLKKLSSVVISSAAIAEIQDLGRLENLQDLALLCLGQLKELPDLSNLKKLRHLLVRNCGELIAIQGVLPESLEDWKITHCGSLQKLPDMSKKLSHLLVDNCGELIASQGVLPLSLQALSVTHCGSLQKLPDMSSSNGLRAVAEIQGLGRLENLQYLELGYLEQVKELDLRNLKKLEQLSVDDCGKLIEIQGLGRLENLEDLELGYLGQVKELPDLSNLKKLRRLFVDNCGELTAIQGVLPESLEELVITHCGSLQKLPDLSSSNGLQAVAEIQGLGRLENLQHLELRYLGQVKELPDLSNLKKLRRLFVENCGELIAIQGVLPESLKELKITHCGSLQKLPDPSSLNGLRAVEVIGCEKLNEEEISRLCSRSRSDFEDKTDESEFEGEDDDEDKTDESEFEGEDDDEDKTDESEFELEFEGEDDDEDKTDESEFEGEDDE